MIIKKNKDKKIAIKRIMTSLEEREREREREQPKF
jgi:hypothetical protein